MDEHDDVYEARRSGREDCTMTQGSGRAGPHGGLAQPREDHEVVHDLHEVLHDLGEEVVLFVEGHVHAHGENPQHVLRENKRRTERTI